MCGIAGSFGFGVSVATVTEMTGAIRHRGPDAGGQWVSSDGRAAFGHRRLSIVDLSPNGAQPMQSASERYVITFNGEVYNFIALRSELIRLGHRFRGGSDTEVILAAIEEWGIDKALGELNGMFAAAVYDRKLSKLFLFRDRLGVKPLHYLWNDKCVYFSSEMSQPFVNLSGREIDRAALGLFFRYNYIPAPYTIYQGVCKVMPGTLLEVSLETVAQAKIARTFKYWDSVERINGLLAGPRLTKTFSESVDLLEVGLSASIKDRMVADVPVGAFLSGGIDSSLVVAHMQRHSARPVRTFTIGFSDARYNESQHAKAIAKHLGTEHTEFIVNEQDALDAIPQMPAIYGEPFADSSQIPTYLVSRLTREAVTVALSGDAGDELFAGYKSYQKLANVERFLGKIPPVAFAAVSQPMRIKAMQRLIRGRAGDQRYEWIFSGLRMFSGAAEHLVPKAKYSISERVVIGLGHGEAVLPLQRCRGSFTEQLMSHETCVYLPDDILTKVDRASMAVSLEVRAPFCDDWRLFDLAWRLPGEHKLDKTGGKLVLKAALARHLPRNLFERPKMGFAVPLAGWLSGPLKEWVHACTNAERIRQEGLLDVDVVRDIVRLARGGDDWYAYKLWALCIFQTWLNDCHRRLA
jgi:asparagine synthase (glutamine-hydrolysing)